MQFIELLNVFILKCRYLLMLDFSYQIIGNKSVDFLNLIRIEELWGSNAVTLVFDRCCRPSHLR